MTSPRLIDRTLLDAVSADAAAHSRRRRNRNFHPADDYPAHRLLNAVEPGSYVAPHRHLDPSKDESLVVLRGRFGIVIFNDDGNVTLTAELAAVSERLGIDIPHGTWHSVVSLEPGSVFFECKAGPFLPLSDAERAPWAPGENDAGAAEYLAWLQRMYSGAGR